MSTTGRILLGIVVAACLLGLAVLEVVSERVQVNSTSMMATPAYLGDSEVWEDPGPSPAQLLAAGRMQRQTVLNVDLAGRRFLSLTGAGQVLESEVTPATVVVAEGRQAADLAVLRPGDVIRVEAPHGRIQRIVVLGNDGQEEENPEN
jgi:hypothetical protein